MADEPMQIYYFQRFPFLSQLQNKRSSYFMSEIPASNRTQSELKRCRSNEIPQTHRSRAFKKPLETYQFKWRHNEKPVRSELTALGEQYTYIILIGWKRFTSKRIRKFRTDCAPIKLNYSLTKSEILIWWKLTVPTLRKWKLNSPYFVKERLHLLWGH